jgi:hypothetical protein
MLNAHRGDVLVTSAVTAATIAAMTAAAAITTHAELAVGGATLHAAGAAQSGRSPAVGRQDLRSRVTPNGGLEGVAAQKSETQRPIAT